MRTTLTLDDALVERLRSDAEALGRSMKDVVNEALRLGLDAMESRVALPYRTQPSDLGLRTGFNYDDIAELSDRDFGRFPSVDWHNPLADESR
ncbi:MAG: CopG family transcriptional regulator [Planctomycetaceae bacterium]|nr:CopG family transcriptional regulator [Planctomycetaceae bacterium]